tara:strand:+ start:365 stop:2770 length:2406 start_codon:yes stop_codon:yes gene_type:complete
MSKMSDNINEANKELKSQQDLLRESADISQSSLDSLKEALGIQQRRTTTEADLLKTGNEINKAIQNQQVGLEGITSLQNQIEKNQKLLSKGKLQEKGLINSIQGGLSKQVKDVENISSAYDKSNSLLQKQYEALAKGDKIDVDKLERLKKVNASQAARLDMEFGALSPLEKQLVAIREQSKALKSQQGLREGELKNVKKLDESLGLSGKLMKGISKIPILGDLVDGDKIMGNVAKKAKKFQEETGKIPGKLQTAKMMAGELGENLLTSITDPLAILTFFAKIFMDVDKQTGKLAKSMNMTYGEANNTRLELSSIANLSRDAALNTDNLQKTLTSVGSALGTNASLNEADLKTFTKLTDEAGFQADEIMKIQKLSLAQGKSLKANTKEILGGAAAYARKNKIAVNEKTILKEVNNMSASLKLSLGGSGDAMARSAVEAKKFGINLEQAESISKGLLEFESSIQNELEAELLTGKDLNLEKARGLALNGDAAGAAAEMLKQVGSSVQYGKMNVIQQESLAKAMNMSREELSKSLIESEALKNIGVESVAAAEEKYNKLRETMTAEEAAVALKDDELAKQFEQKSMQEDFNNSVAKLKDIFVTIVQEVLPAFKLAMTPILFIVQAIGTGIGMFVKGLKEGSPLAITLAAVLGAMAIPALISAVGAIMSTFAMIPLGIGIPIGIAAVAGMYGMATKAKSVGKVKDGVIDPKGGIMMSGEKGSIQLDKDDSVVAGTNLFGGKKGGSSQNPQSQGNIDMTPVINAINALASRPINVQVGEDVIIKAAVGNDPKVTGDEMGKNSYQLN